MRTVSSDSAFQEIAKILSGSEDLDWKAPSEPSVDRLKSALEAPNSKVSSLDLAVLLRQALRREYARREYSVSPTVLVRHPRLRSFDQWNEVGLAAALEGDGLRVASRAWRPDWLTSYKSDLGAEDGASGESVRRLFGEGGCEGDPFLSSIGRNRYRSRGQRASVRAALSTPPGGTLVIALPTGEGKSMIFQLVHAVGFVASEIDASQSVTLVIVPTVALGINHENEAVDVCGLARPLAYQGGADVGNSIISQRVAEGIQGLCFASPEAACGPLRSALRKAAELGRLRAIVIDEAHLVDQWGTGFRTEFQELSGLRRELRSLSPVGATPRTLLLSATLTDSSLETLRVLFGEDCEFESIAAVRLRPEPDYWVSRGVQNADEGTRTKQVIEALHHVPRPAILYVTKVEHAEFWRQQLVGVGFRRIRMMHGRTSREEREMIVSEWRSGLVDIVIGTSAFGLGIDYPHARSVLHACVPETLDRFYQEVGRGGRDGRTSLSLSVPAGSDWELAERLNRQNIITTERGIERWASMFSSKRLVTGHLFAVRVDASPGFDESDIDMTGDLNADWNLRTLALMARSGIVRLLGAPKYDPEYPGDWFVVEILDDGHLDPEVWDQRVEPVRQTSSIASARNLKLMNRFFQDQECPAEVLSELYGAERTIRACSACGICRLDASKRQISSSIGEPRIPWKIPTPDLLARLLDDEGRLLLTYDPLDGSRSASRRFASTLERLQRMGLAKLIIVGRAPFELDRALQSISHRPFFVSEVVKLAYASMPQGPEIVLVGPDAEIGEASLASSPSRRRILIIPQDYRVPSGHLLRDVFGGRTLNLDTFHARVAQ